MQSRRNVDLSAQGPYNGWRKGCCHTLVPILLALSDSFPKKISTKSWVADGVGDRIFLIIFLSFFFSARVLVAQGFLILIRGFKEINPFENHVLREEVQVILPTEATTSSASSSFAYQIGVSLAPVLAEMNTPISRLGMMRAYSGTGGECVFSMKVSGYLISLLLYGSYI